MTINAHRLFLIDTIGAGISTSMMLVFAQFPKLIGMPLLVLYIFAFVGFGCFVYSLINYTVLIRNWGFNLKGIAIVNGIYALSVIVMVFIHFEDMTWLGILYFGIEVIILVILSWLEYKVGSWST